MGLRPTPGVSTAPALHRRVLWIHRPDALLLARPPQHHFDAYLCHSPAGMSPLVSSKLLSNGFEQSTVCYVAWRAAGRCVDDQLKRKSTRNQDWFAERPQQLCGLLGSRQSTIQHTTYLIFTPRRKHTLNAELSLTLSSFRFPAVAHARLCSFVSKCSHVKRILGFKDREISLSW